MKEGDMPTLSSRIQAQTRREWAEHLLMSSAEVDGRTFFTALQRSVAILLPVMNSKGAFLVLYQATGMSSSCARQQALMTICSAPRMGHIAGFIVSSESLIFWPF
jgi:hypothetical protein